MNTKIFEQILTDQKEEAELKARKKVCKRREEDLVDLNSTQAQVVIGVRRSGKSTLCHHVLHEAGVKYAYVNFDDERLSKTSGEDLNTILELLYRIYGDFTHLFIDEIQNIPEWYLFVNRLLRRDMHVLVSGSNAKLLSGELATHLTGRHHEIRLYPFSFAEYCRFYGVDTQSRSTKANAFRMAAFDRYMQTGGFPEIHSVSRKKDYIDTLVDNILKRDIEHRFSITYKAAFEQMAQHLLNIAPTVVADKKLKETFAFKSEHTAKNYVRYLQQAYLLSPLCKYSTKSRIRTVGVKAYPIDVALMNNRENAFIGENLGARLETVVYIELLRRCREKGLDLNYYADRLGECDFILCQGNQAKTGIQVSYDISNPKTLKRELQGLWLAATKTGCKELLLLTDREYAETTFRGLNIAIRPVYEWALEEK